MSEASPVCVVSAPSGAGKTTLNRLLVSQEPKVALATSHTTRVRREGEVDGRDYYFVSTEQFRALQSAEAFLESAQVHGRWYGSSKAEVERIRKMGRIALLEIDVQGFLSVRKLSPELNSVFILPPSLKTLWERLENRGSDDLNTRWLRFNNAYDEIDHASAFNTLIVNDEVPRALGLLKQAVLGTQRVEAEQEYALRTLTHLKSEYEKADWLVTLRKALKA